MRRSTEADRTEKGKRRHRLGNVEMRQELRCMSVIQALRRQRQEQHKFKVILGYIKIQENWGMQNFVHHA